MRKSLFSAVISVFAAAVVANPALACTGISLGAQDGSMIRGRTLEFGFELESNVLVVPPGQALVGTLPDGGDGMRFTTRYGFVGANLLGLTGLVDGVNDQGLSAGLFYFPGYAGYAAPTAENAAKAVAPHQFLLWVLGSFATVDEVRAGLDGVAIVPTPTPGLGSPAGMVAPMHAFLRDKSGKTLVIEPVGGELMLHESPLGIMTNAPTYDWHMTNLNVYLNLSVDDVEQAKLGDLTLNALSSGTGLVGLPGDFTSPSRFVRASIFATHAVPTATVEDTVFQAFHILNQFDIPPGSAQNSAVGGTSIEYTEWTAVSDLANQRWYFRTLDDQSIRMVDVKAAVAAAGGGIVQLPMDSKQTVLDISTAMPVK